jgi:outer membrane protein TolC
VLSVELAQDQLAALRIKAHNGRNLLRRALAKYIGMPDEDIDIDTTLNKDIIAPEQLAVNTQTAMENRGETRLLDLWVEKSVLERKIASANMLPILVVGASANYSQTTTSQWNPRAMGFIGVQMPLSTFWSERHEYRRKIIEEKKANDFRQDKRELITLQIQDAYDNLVSTYQQTQVAQKSIARAEENMRINREHYREGLTTMTVLLDAQSQHQQAMSQYHTAVSEYLQAKTKYLILTGRRY